MTRSSRSYPIAGAVKSHAKTLTRDRPEDAPAYAGTNLKIVAGFFPPPDSTYTLPAARPLEREGKVGMRPALQTFK
jgi:hypothetical protein